MENTSCVFCHQFSGEHKLFQCNHRICSKCRQAHFPIETHPRHANDNFFSSFLNSVLGKNKKQVANTCPACNEKPALIATHDAKYKNDQQLRATSGWGKNQEQHIPDDILQWLFQFLDAKVLFTKIRFTCKRMDKFMCTSILSLHCQGLRIDGLKFARKVLPKETQLQELNLMANNIGLSEAIIISNALTLLKQLTVLDLSWNNITDSGAIVIANAVKHLKQLQVLNISYNPIEDSGITAISNATKVLSILQRLDNYEKHSQKISERVQEVFYMNGNLLHLECCNIGPVDAIAVAKVLPHLTQLLGLNLDDNEIGDSGATGIASSITNLTQLQELSFCNNQIGDSGAAAIANSISDLAQLEYLNLGSNEIGDFGAIAIATSITNSTRLYNLTLYSNRIGDVGATEIANAVSKLPKFDYLYFYSNMISFPVKQQLKEQLHKKLRIFNTQH